MIKCIVSCDTCKKVFQYPDKMQVSISEYTNGSLGVALSKAGWLVGRKIWHGKGYHVCSEECREKLKERMEQLADKARSKLTSEEQEVLGI